MAALTLNIAAPATLAQVEAALGVKPSDVDWEAEETDLSDGFDVCVTVFAARDRIDAATDALAVRLSATLGVEVITDQVLLAREATSNPTTL